MVLVPAGLRKAEQKASDKKTSTNGSGTKCPRCGTQNNAANVKCSKCKWQLDQTPTAADLASVGGGKLGSGQKTGAAVTGKGKPPPGPKRADGGSKKKPKGDANGNQPPGPKRADGGNKKKSTDTDAVWQKAYNAALKRGADKEKAKKAADNAVKMANKGSSVKKNYTIETEVSKADDDLMQVYGWGYVSEIDGEPVADYSGEHVPIEEIEKGAIAFNLNGRDAGEMHLLKGRGDLIESMVFTKEKWEALGIDPSGMPKGWWVGFQMSDRECYQKAKSGDYPMFSIHGTALRSLADSEADPAELVASAKREVEAAESYYELSKNAVGYLNLQASVVRTERMSGLSKGVGPSRHGPSIKCPDIYEALRREGKSKTNAAQISNECYSSGQCKCH